MIKAKSVCLETKKLGEYTISEKAYKRLIELLADRKIFLSNKFKKDNFTFDLNEPIGHIFKIEKNVVDLDITNKNAKTVLDSLDSVLIKISGHFVVDEAKKTITDIFNIKCFVTSAGVFLTEE